MASGTITYIDGSNLLRETAKELGFPDARSDKPTREHLIVGCLVARAAVPYAGPPLRQYWFGSYQGTDDDRDSIREVLREQGFDAHLFKQKRQRKEKGVDIALTKEMLVHAFHRNCSDSILVAGDEDYVSLIQEVKRYGQKVHVAFYTGPTSPELRMASDIWHPLEGALESGANQERIDAFRDAQRIAVSAKPAP